MLRSDGCLSDTHKGAVISFLDPSPAADVICACPIAMWSIPLGSFNTVQSRGKNGNRDSGDYRGIAFNASRLKGVLLLLEDLDV